MKDRVCIFDETKVEGFFPPYRFLSNYWPVEVEIEGVLYPSVEQAYKAMKTNDVVIRQNIAKLLPNKIELGEQIENLLNGSIRSDWTDSLRLEIMEKLVTMKFDGRDMKLRQKLIETGDRQLIEANNWDDTFFGVCNGIGHNHLGKILMKVRSSIKGE